MSTEHRTWLGNHIDAMAAVVDSVDHNSPVPSCPDWTLRDLVVHTGRVHQMAAGALRTADPDERPRTSAPDDGADLGQWFRDGAADLLDALDASDPDAPAWTFVGPQPSSFWLRRMSNETAIHAWDASLAAGDPLTLSPEQGVDLIDEFFEVYVPRLGTDTFADADGRTFHLHATDADGEWEIRRSPEGMEVLHEHAKSTTALRGPAAQLGLYIWSRERGADLEVFGDESQVAEWNEKMSM